MNIYKGLLLITWKNITVKTSLELKMECKFSNSEDSKWKKKNLVISQGISQLRTYTMDIAVEYSEPFKLGVSEW